LVSKNRRYCYNRKKSKIQSQFAKIQADMVVIIVKNQKFNVYIFFIDFLIFCFLFFFFLYF